MVSAEACARCPCRAGAVAGSERLSKTDAKGQQANEARAINSSLSALGVVINALAKQSTTTQKVHVPFRNSKLTLMLKKSFTGNGLTCMIAAISPADDNADESLSSMSQQHTDNPARIASTACQQLGNA